MSSDYENDDRENNDRDELVSNRYRELRAERTPEHLNQAILQMAADDGKRASASRFLSVGWMKPVAWAATIGLSLAIVLELTQVPTSEAPRTATPQALDSVSDEFSAAEKQSLRQAGEQAARRTSNFEMEAARSEVAEGGSTPAVENKLMRRPADIMPESAPAPAPTQERRQEPALVIEEAVVGNADRLRADAEPEIAMESPAEPAFDQAAARKRASDQTEADAGAASEDVAVEEFAAFAASVVLEDSDTAPGCEPDTRALAEDWLACIEELRSSGKAELADLEYEAYALKYPEDPDTN